jgi:hypothetical protein
MANVSEKLLPFENISIFASLLPKAGKQTQNQLIT